MKGYIIKNFIFLFVTTLSSCILASEGAVNTPSLHFTPLSLPSTIHKNAPKCIYKSSKGEFWYCYEKFLVRKRGEQYQYFSWPEQPLDLQQKIIEYDNQLLVSLNNKLLRFDESSQSMVNFSEEISFNKPISTLLVDTRGNFWVSTLFNIFLYKPASNQFKMSEIPISLQPDVPTPLFLDLIEDGDFLWARSAFLGLIKISPSETAYTYIEANQQHRLPPHDQERISSIERWKKNKLLVGTNKGIYLFNTNSEKFVALFKDQIKGAVDNILANQYGGFIFENTNNAVYLANDPSGLTRINLANNNIKPYKTQSIFLDDENTLWLGTESYGIGQYSPASLQVVSEKALGIDINGIYTQSNNSKQVLVSSLAGSYLLDGTTIIDKPVFSMHVTDAQGTLLGGNNKITQLFDNKITVFNTDDSLSNEIISMTLMDNQIWYISSNSGLNVLDIKTGKNIHTSKFNISRESAQTYIHITSSNTAETIYMVTRSQFIEFSPKTQQIKTIANFKNNITHVQSSFNNTYMFDNEAEVHIFSHSSKLLSLEKLPIEEVQCYLAKDSNSAWLGQKNGNILFWNKETKHIEALNTFNGLPKGGFNGRACLNVGNRNYYTSYNGLVSTSNSPPIINLISPQVIISSNMELTTKSDAKNAPSLEQSDFPLKFRIASSSYQSPEENQYKFRLIGLNDNWSQVKHSDTSINYQTLSAGKYQFQARASNNDGVWSEVKSISFSVLAPWYLTKLAISSYIASLLLSFYLFYRFRLNQANKKSKELELQVMKRTEELAQEKKIVETLLNTKEQEFVHLSHELRTPLTLVLGPLKALVNDELDSKKLSKLKVIQRNGQRLLRMVDQLLHLERFRIQQVEERVIQNVALSLRLVVESFHAVAIQKNITIELADTISCNGKFIPDAFEKIFLNIISNAIKYTQKDGKVIVSSCLLTNGDLKISVQDTGLGIKSELLPKIFEKYYRVTNHTSEKVTGSGIGLSLVKQLVQSHDAVIEVSSTYSIGSTFTVIFPKALLTEDSAGNETLNTELVEIEVDELKGDAEFNEDTLESSEEDGKPVLLIVEDNGDMRNYISETLSNHYSVHLAINGKHGLEKAIQLIPDLIISDVMMPEMDGLELCEALKTNMLTSHVPIILLTARGDRETRIQGWRKATDEYLTKPFDEEELIIRVSNLLSIRKLLRTRFGRQFEDGNAIASDAIEDSYSAKDAEFLEKAKLIVDNRYIEPSFTAIIFAKDIAMSERQLQRKLKLLVDVTPKEYIRVYRLNKAKDLLKEGLQISVVADNCGFSSPSYFSSCFKAKFGMTAKQYQNSHVLN